MSECRGGQAANDAARSLAVAIRALEGNAGVVDISAVPVRLASLFSRSVACVVLNSYRENGFCVQT